MQIERIAFVGLEGLAPAMAARLLAAGCAVTVHDPVRPLDELRNAGAHVARLPADAAEEVDVVVLAASGREAHDHLFDHGGLTETLPTGGCVLDMSECPPDQSRATSERLARYGLLRLELCPLGSTADARSGQLVLLVGGASRDVAATAAATALLGRVWHVGPLGSAPAVASVLRDALRSRPGPAPEAAGPPRDGRSVVQGETVSGATSTADDQRQQAVG